MILNFKLKENDIIENTEEHIDGYIFDKDSSLENNGLLDLKLKAVKKLIELSEKLDTEDAIKVHCNEADILSIILMNSFYSLKEKYFNLIISYYCKDTGKVYEI